MTAHKNWLEWSVFAAGLALVLAIVGYLVVQLARHEDAPARLDVRAGAPWRADDVEPAHFVVPVTVTNHGDRSVADVHVEVTLTQGGAPLERSELRLAEVPRRSKRTGAVTLEHEPAPDRLRVRVLGYGEP